MAVPGAAPGLLGLKLVARKPDPDFEWLAIAVDPVSFQIRHLVALDRQGGQSAFTFTNLKENQRPPDTLFEFRIPKGVDVVTNDPRVRPPSSPVASGPLACWHLCWRWPPAPPPAAANLRQARLAERAAGLRPAPWPSTPRRPAPGPTTARSALSLDRAKLRASQDHFARARRHAATGRTEEALVEYQLAAELNPGQRRNPERTAHAARARCARRWPSIAAARPRSRRSSRTASAAPLPGADLPTGRHAARLAGLPRRQRPRRLHGDRQVRRHERRLRPGVPRSAAQHRSAQGAARRGAVIGGHGDAPLLARHRAADGHRHPRHRRQAPRVRGRGRPHVLPEQRRSQGDHGHAAHRGRRAAPGADDGHQRHHDQGHAGAGGGRGPHHPGHRQGAARGRHRRRAARGRSHASARSTACRSPRPPQRPPASTARQRSNRDGPDAARPAQPHAVRRAADQPARAVLPAAQERHQHAHARQPAAAHVGGHRRPGPLRRAGAGAGHDLRADRRRRRADAADHVVQLREHRREHRHHAAHAPRRRRVAGGEDRDQQHLGQRASAACRPSATARSARSSACATARRTCWPASSATTSARWRRESRA